MPDQRPKIKSRTLPKIREGCATHRSEAFASTRWKGGPPAAWFYIYRDSTREWVFYTGARTFEDRYKLARDRGIQGFCAWVLRDEDPDIWDLLPDANRK